MATTQTLPTALTSWYKSANNATVPKTSGMLTQGGSTQAAATTYNPTTLKDASQWSVTPEQTAAGNVEAIAKKDSPLMQLAQTKGLQQANQRGLLNSSMAVGAAQDSVLEAATPLAQFDADIKSKAAGYNAETANTFAKTNAAMQNEAKNFGAQAINRANEFNASNEFNRRQQDDSQAFDKETRLGTQAFDKETRLGKQAFDKETRLGTQAFDKETRLGTQAFDKETRLGKQAFDKETRLGKQAFDKQQDLFEANVKASLAQIENEAKFDQQSQHIYGSLGKEFTSAMLEINKDTNMNQLSKDYSIRQMFNAYRAQISMLSAVGSVPDVSRLLRSNY